MIDNFDDIRPYRDDEVNDAMCRITADPLFPIISNYVYPDRTPQDVADFMRSIQTVQDFQYSVMRAFNEGVISKTIRNFTYSGIENVPRDHACLFVSNHRDIVLDACLMQYILYLNDLPTTQITFGSNLMSSQFLVDIGRSNRMFRVERPGNASPRQFYEYSMRLSQYLRHVVCDLDESVWIAQRNGRTKNGIDRTNPAIIKMFGMAQRRSMAKGLADLSIVPVSVSYQIEPCAEFKAREILASSNGVYKKAPGEDLNSIITGIIQYKGDVHFHFSAPVTADVINDLESRAPQRLAENVAEYMDSNIISGYKLHSTNYVAADVITGIQSYADKYTADDKAEFLKMINEVADADVRREMCKIYANPLLENDVD